jgi:alkylation response protein AidB-like acyl-CoA dehydrogenase
MSLTDQSLKKPNFDFEKLRLDFNPDIFISQFSDHPNENFNSAIKVFSQLITASRLFNQMCELARNYSLHRQVFEKNIFDIYPAKLKILHAETMADIYENNINQIIFLIQHSSEQVSRILKKITATAFFLKHDIRNHLDNLIFIHGGHGYMSESPIAKVWESLQKIIDALASDSELIAVLS